MRSNKWGAMIAGVGAVISAVACGNASTLADDINFMDTAVQTVSYEQSVPYEVGAIRAAFLEEQPAVVARKAPQPRPTVKRLSHETSMEQALDEAASGQHGYDISPQGGCSTCAEGCPTCSDSKECNCEMCQLNETCEGPGSVYYAEVQIMMLRAHLMDEAIGKLSEKYEWSPRLVAGYENAHGIGGRGRWWHYSHETPILGGDDIHFSFDTIDIEATARFAMKKADLLVSGGTRWAAIDVEFDDDTNSTGAPGLTVAADLRMELCRKCNNQWAAIGGGRWSTLGGDWEGGGGLITETVRDDNIVVQEIYIGVEYNQLTKAGHNVFMRLTYEIQNWHSDAMSQLSGTDSIGFVGPGLHAGASF